MESLDGVKLALFPDAVIVFNLFLSSFEGGLSLSWEILDCSVTEGSDTGGLYKFVEAEIGEVLFVLARPRSLAESSSVVGIERFIEGERDLERSSSEANEFLILLNRSPVKELT